MLNRTAAVFSLTLLLFAATGCQSAPQLQTEPVELPSAVGQVVDSLYDVISGPAGEARDWERLRSLFHSDARMVPMVPDQISAAEDVRAAILTPDDYIQRAGPALERDGFFEQEIARRGQVFGDFAHVWSTYEGRRALADEKPFLRGINSIQLVRESGTWRVLQIVWEQEAQAGAVPPWFLPAAQ
ncbi:MAG: nuclear transport factor 2 family protein [Planctomycetota bacterium]